VILRRLFYILFSILFFMIAVSFSILFYSCAFKSQETDFLLISPLSPQRVFMEKFIEASILACWIPFLGIILFMLVYCNISNLNPLFVVLFLLYLLPFLCICVCLATVAVLAILRYLTLKKITAGVVSLCAALLFFYYRKFPAEELATSYFITQDFAFLKFSRTWYLPFYWITEGFVKLEEKRFAHSFVFLMNLCSLAVLSIRVLPFLGRRLFLECYFKYSTDTSKKIHKKGLWDFICDKLPVPVYLKEFILKDIKLFLRDPRQWLQSLIFFGFLFFYFLNMRHFSYHAMGIIWRNLIMFLNTFGILCIASTLSVRFIFPQWSLEGHNFWILKLSPVPLRKVFLEKLVVSVFFFAPISLVLILTSNIMLQVEGFLFYFTVCLVLIGCITLVSISLSSGAYFADFKSSYYLKAVESVGGFLNLAFNLGYLIISVFGFFIIAHFSLTGRINIDLQKTLLISGIIWAAFSFFVCVLSSYLGLRMLEKKEL